MVKKNMASTVVLSLPSASPSPKGVTKAAVTVPPAGAAVQSSLGRTIFTLSPLVPVTSPLAKSLAPPKVITMGDAVSKGDEVVV